jgi:hypothetical protein
LASVLPDSSIYYVVIFCYCTTFLKLLISSTLLAHIHQSVNVETKVKTSNTALKWGTYLYCQRMQILYTKYEALKILALIGMDLYVVDCII